MQQFQQYIGGTFSDGSGHFESLDPATGAGSSVTEGNFTGGTGRFEGASGPVTIEVTVGVDVAGEPGAPASVSVVNGTTVGTLVLP